MESYPDRVPPKEALGTLSKYLLCSLHQILPIFTHTSFDAVMSLLKYAISCTVSVLPFVILKYVLKLMSSFRLYQIIDSYGVSRFVF